MSQATLSETPYHDSSLFSGHYLDERVTDLTETEADLIEAFVPVAVDEAGGFADFRETATRTNSLVDRL